MPTIDYAAIRTLRADGRRVEAQRAPGKYTVQRDPVDWEELDDARDKFAVFGPPHSAPALYGQRIFYSFEYGEGDEGLNTGPLATFRDKEYVDNPNAVNDAGFYVHTANTYANWRPTLAMPG